MKDTTSYTARAPDSNGYIHYEPSEHQVWETLYHRQFALIQDKACEAYLIGLDRIGLSPHHIPQCKEISEALKAYTGWTVAPVAALISFKAFFDLLAHQIFPAASFIRRPEELDYLKEPDIFHEIFGHCPLLTDPAFAAFTQEVGRFGQGISPEDRKMLARLYWFTVEFGLIQTPNQPLKIYGAGIVSSKTESIYALQSPIPERKPFDLLTVLRMPYRYDALQKTYFVIDSIERLYNMVNGQLLEAFREANALGILSNPHEIHDAAMAQDYRSC